MFKLEFSQEALPLGMEISCSRDGKWNMCQVCKYVVALLIASWMRQVCNYVVALLIAFFYMCQFISM